MPYTQGPAVSVHWLDIGEGQPLVLLHGLGGDSDFWTEDIKAWSERFRLIVLDLRGSGLTGASEGGHTIDDLADDVAAVLSSAGIDSADVLGFSMGGLVAQSFAIRHPDRLRRLVLAATYATMSEQARLFLDAVLSTYEQTESATTMFRLIYPWLFSPAYLADPTNRSSALDPDLDLAGESLSDWRAAYLASRAFDSRSGLASVQTPTTVIAGNEDRLVPMADAEELAELISNARLEIIQGSGHLINVEEQRLFRAIVEEFLL